MKRILFFTPYTPWLPHTMWELTLAYALQQRGHTTRFVTCQGLPDCGLRPIRTNEPEGRCDVCRNYTQEAFPDLGLMAQYMQTQATSKEKADIAEWTKNLATDELRQSKYREFPLGEWVWPELLNCWGTPDPDLSLPEVEASYRRYLYGAAVAAVSLPRIYDLFRPDAVVTLNGSFFLHRVAFNLARMRDIRVITHERGLQDNTITLNANELIWGEERLKRVWEPWKDTPLTIEELRAVERLLAERRRGQNMGWYAFSPSPQDLQEVRRAANLPDKPLALLCTTSDAEASLVERSVGISQREWIFQTIEWFRAHPEYALVIRAHPNERERDGVSNPALDRYKAWKPTLPENVRLILPEEDVSTYSLMDIASVGLSYGTTAGLEMACLGIPVVHAGIGVYKNAGFTHEIESSDDIPSVMARVMELPRSEETQRKAYRFAHRYFLALSVPFNKIKISSDFITAEMNYKHTSELAPGLDKDLDRMTAYILDEGELYPPPSPLRVLETTRREDQFFAEQRVSGLLQAATQHRDRADLLLEAANILRGIGLIADSAAVYNAAQQRNKALGVP